jgi:L,D-peptidoglycan transpeptidase YkuD (ErfK/YbiS/YcfS/YnhG family)
MPALANPISATILRDFVVTAEGVLRRHGRQWRCAVGRGGVRSEKREGDGATPAGRFPLRRLLYRADRLPAPTSVLPADPLAANDGWCDEPADAAYNRQVKLPYDGRHERLWRDDGLYDVIVVIGHNDDPVVPGRGSAVFLHVAGPGYPPTDGCVALALRDLLELLAAVSPSDHLLIEPR